MKNKKNRLLNLVVMLMVFSSIPLFGQPGQGAGRGPGMGGRQMSEEDVKERVNTLSETLKLSDGQTTELTKYEIDAYKKGQIERQKFDGDRDAMRAYFMESREARDKKYEDVLTKEQMDEFTKLQEERRQQRRQQGDQQRTGQDGERPDRGRGRN